MEPHASARADSVSNERDSAQGAVRLGSLFSHFSFTRFERSSEPERRVTFAGGQLRACSVIVIVTHIAEALRLFPAMGWGEPRSIGHYVDLTSAIGGIALLALSVLVRIRAGIT